MSMKNILKKVSKLLMAIILFFMGKSVLAFNADFVNVSDDINVIFSDSNNVKIKLSDNLKNNNSNIYYQLISANPDELMDFENKNNKIENDYQKCTDGDACAYKYNLEKKNLSSEIPNYNEKDWKLLDSSSTIYTISNLKMTDYWLWVKAKDNENNDIYSVFYKTGSVSLAGADDVEIVTIRNYNANYTHDVLAIASLMFSGIGMTCFVISLLFIYKECILNKRYVKTL